VLRCSWPATVAASTDSAAIQGKRPASFDGRPLRFVHFCQTGTMTQPAAATPESPQEPIASSVELRWPDDVGADAQAVNQVLVSWDQEITDILYVYLGHVAPPPWLTGEIAQERLAEIGNQMKVTPKGAFVLSRSRAEELWSVLGRHLGKLPPE
jgi:hypothetical protein